MQKIISPKYKISLIEDVEHAIWEEFRSYRQVKLYIDQWYETDEYGNWENFRIIKSPIKEMDLLLTLGTMDDETLLKVAIDIGVETPDFIPSIPTFRNEIKSNYSTASLTFEKAFKQIEQHPDVAIGLVNSALESIIKEILKDTRISTQVNATGTLYALTGEILKAFCLFPNSNMPPELKTIGSSLLSINQSIEKLRSEKTHVHGKTTDDYVVEDPLYAYFIVNSISTIGLFLVSYYKKKLPKEKKIESNLFDDLPF